MDKEELKSDHKAYPMQEAHGHQQDLTTQHLDTHELPADNNHDGQVSINIDNQQAAHLNGHHDDDLHNGQEHEMVQINRSSASADLNSELPPLPPNGQPHNASRRNSAHSVHSYHSQTPKPTYLESSPPVSVIKSPKNRPTCLPWCCPCIRSTCLRITCCLCLIIVIIIAVLAILVFAVFKLPTIDYMGTIGSPSFTFNKGNTTFGVDMVADIRVKNPNPLGFGFQLVAIEAYFPGFRAALGGKGNVTNVHFPSHSIQSIQFPIQVAYDRHQDPGLNIIKDVLQKCGILGGTSHNMTINYDVMASVKVLGISMGSNLENQTYSFVCPENIREIASEIPGGISAIIGDIKGGIGGIGDLIGGIGDKIGGIGGTIGDTIGGIGGTIGGHIGG
ncbi:hypothetical protein BGW39_005848 [Mortierella sp. 14UC]|nr:hypothetical protein BGW39_005848 [Mortierella sp. 14UC]